MKFRKIAFALFLSLSSFIGYSQINVTTNFNIVAGAPIDTRMVVADTNARNSIAWRFEGMSVYVISNKTNYQLTGGIANSDWVSLSPPVYAAGTGLSLSGNSFVHDPHTGDVTGTTSLTIAAIQGRTLATTAPTSGDVLGWNGSAWAPVTALNNYSIGTGLTLSSNTLSALNNSAIWNANQLNGTSISTTAPTNNQILKWTGTEWLPANENAYDAGTGIILLANTFTADNNAPIWNANLLRGNSISTNMPNNNQLLKWNGTEWIPANEVAYDAGTGIALSGNTFFAQNTSPIWNANQIMGATISTTAPNNNQLLKWNGTEWIPANEVAYDAGTGIALSGNTFFAQNTSPIWNANQIMGATISTTAPNNNQLLKWNGTEWIPANEVAYDAGTGITLTGNTFLAQNTTAIWNANQLMGASVSTNAPAANEVLTWNGSTWVPAPSQLNYYDAGTGLTLTGNTFSAQNNAAIWNANQLQSSAVSNTVPSNNQVLKYTGATWTPTDENAYDAGTGISLTSNTFSHIPHTGDAAGSTSLTVTGLQGRQITTATPTTGNVLKWNGTLWAMGSSIDTFNGNRTVTRSGIPNVNVGTNTTLADFVNAYFFPFITATIAINAGTVWEIGTSNTITISGGTTPNNETVFSGGRLDRIFPAPTTTVYTFGAAMSFSTTASFVPIAGVASTLQLQYIAYQQVGNNGSPTTINSATRTTTSVFPYLHGVSTTNFTTGGTATYSGLTKLVQTQSNKTVNYNGTGYIYFCYPTSYGTLTSILDQSSFEQIGAFNVTTQTVSSVGLVNNWSTSYYIYSSKTISTPTNNNFTLRY